MIQIRKAEIKDNSAITQLSHQLGYAISEADSYTNLEYILKSKNDIVFVAVNEDRIVCWMQVSKLVHLETDMFCEIVGLVTDVHVRGNGIGKQMLICANRWAKENNCKRIVVRSNVVRMDTHRFYTANGFAEKKEQKVFDVAVN